MAPANRVLNQAFDSNSDPRSRAQSRAVLMALARKREWYFEASLITNGLWAFVTLGIGPLLGQSRRFDRFRRLEWNQYHAFAQWLARATGDEIAGELETFAERAWGRPSSRIAIVLCAVAALTLLIVIGVRTLDWRAVLTTAFWPQSLYWPAITFGAVLLLGWVFHLMAVIRQQAMTRLWIGRLNELLAGYDRRPVPLGVSLPGWPMLLLTSALAIIGPVWLAMTLFALALGNRYTLHTRAARLAMLERMLEWMDTSGLPVEFDIEEIEPGELVEMTGAATV